MAVLTHIGSQDEWDRRFKECPEKFEGSGFYDKSTRLKVETKSKPIGAPRIVSNTGRIAKRLNTDARDVLKHIQKVNPGSSIDH